MNCVPETCPKNETKYREKLNRPLEPAKLILDGRKLKLTTYYGHFQGFGKDEAFAL